MHRKKAWRASKKGITGEVYDRTDGGGGKGTTPISIYRHPYPAYPKSRSRSLHSRLSVAVMQAGAVGLCWGRQCLATHCHLARL